MDEEQQYAALVARFPRADRRELIDAFEAATRAAEAKVVGDHLLVRMVLAGVAPEVIEAAELEMAALRVEAEIEVEAALTRAGT